jgi:hypothetical protein
MNSDQCTEPDDDYVVRLLGFIWRFRKAFAVMLLSGVAIAALNHHSEHQFRTTLNLRLVSPCVAYRHVDYWVPSGKAWRSQLIAASENYKNAELLISVHAGSEPWLLSLTADHPTPESAEMILVDLIRDVDRQLGSHETSAIEKNQSLFPIIDSAGMMTQLRVSLTSLEESLARYGVAHDETVINAVDTSPFSQKFFSGTFSPVPIQSVPYFPWFERLHNEVCTQLSLSASAGERQRLTLVQQQELAENLENACTLVSQIWFSMDPMNPVQKLPQGQILSVHVIGTQKQSMLSSAGTGFFYTALALLAFAMFAEWCWRNGPQILQRSAVRSAWIPPQD